MATYKMRGVNKTTAKGRTYFYWRATGERLPDDEHERVMRVALLQAKHSTDGTLAGLIAHYYRDSNFATRADGTRMAYGMWFDRLEAKWGERPVAGINREVVLNIGAAFNDTPSKRDSAIRFLSVLLRFALDYPSRYGLDHNPAVGVDPTHKPTPYPAWPREVYLAALEQAPLHLRRAIVAGLNTGQRISDIVRFAWSNWDGQGLTVHQMKTGTTIWIPASTEMAEMVADCPREAAVVLTTASGRPWVRGHLQNQIKAFMEKLGRPDLSMHGLRKSTGYVLAEHDCTPHQIQSILGCSLQMAAHYTKAADQKRLAKSAVVKLNRWGNDGD